MSTPSNTAQTAMITAEDMRSKLTEKALQNSDFRAQLISDPKGTIRQELGIDVPESINIQVHTSDKNNFQLALPAGPALDAEQLEQIAAGLSCCI